MTVDVGIGQSNSRKIAPFALVQQTARKVCATNIQDPRKASSLFMTAEHVLSTTIACAGFQGQDQVGKYPKVQVENQSWQFILEAAALFPH